jgi:hypothetical protein
MGERRRETHNYCSWGASIGLLQILGREFCIIFLSFSFKIKMFKKPTQKFLTAGS